MGSLSIPNRLQIPIGRRPSLPRTPKPSLLTPKSSSQTPPRPLLESAKSLLKPAVISLVAGSAVLSGHLNHPHSLALAVEQTPQNPNPSPVASEEVEVLQELMETKIKEGKLSEAVEVMDRLLALQPGDKDLLLLKAHVFTHAGDVESAKTVFEDVLLEEPLRVEAYHGLVVIATKEAEAGKDGVREIDRIMKRVKVAAEKCEKEGKKAELRDFKLLVAQVWVMEGEYDEALGVYQDLVLEEPMDFRPYLCQGIIYTLLKKKDEAEKQFEKYRRLVPKEHPYAQYFEENMGLMKAFDQKQEKKRPSVLKS